MKTHIILLAAMAAMTLTPARAQGDRDANLKNLSAKGWEIEMRAGVNIGGAAPLPFPRAIRRVDSYNPRLNGVAEGVVTRWIGGGPWGVATGLRVESRGMDVKAQVKDYHTEVIKGDQRVAGYYTGHVRTKLTSTLLTVPVMASYRISQRWKVRAGLDLSWMMDGDFSGYVSDGHMRNLTPTGERIPFEGEARGTYDFSSSLRRLQVGARVGASWRAYRHLSVVADLGYGFGDVFHHDFSTVGFALHPVNLSVGFGYTF